MRRRWWWWKKRRIATMFQGGGGGNEGGEEEYWGHPKKFIINSYVNTTSTYLSTPFVRYLAHR
jgi:hypothetical protein